jgi:antirestriction protein ArdC
MIETNFKLKNNIMENTKELNKVQSKVIDSLIDNVLNSPNFSWQKTWENIATGNSPYNPISKNQYSGLNKFILNLNASIKGSNQFATFNQISNANGKIKTGSKAIPLMFFSWKYFDYVAKKSYTANQINKLSSDIQNRLRKFPFHSYFNVFSLSDCENIHFDEPKIEVKNDPIVECEKIVSNWNETESKINIGLDNERAYFSPSIDIVNMPHLQAFKSSKNFYMVAFHEIAHSTGIKKRLNRDMGGMFGNDKYAKEELIAELTSTLIGASMNILTKEVIDNTTAYLKSWTKRMTDKKAELYSGLNGAIKAFDYIIKATN